MTVSAEAKLRGRGAVCWQSVGRRHRPPLRIPRAAHAHTLGQAATLVRMARAYSASFGLNTSVFRYAGAGCQPGTWGTCLQCVIWFKHECVSIRWGQAATLVRGARAYSASFGLNTSVFRYAAAGCHPGTWGTCLQCVIWFKHECVSIRCGRLQPTLRAPLSGTKDVVNQCLEFGCNPGT